MVAGTLDTQRGSLQICTACGATSSEFGPGPNGRPNASCKRCKSLERHRFLTLLVEIVAPRVLAEGTLLDIAPSSTTTPRLRELGGERYVSVDFDPGADKRVVDVRASLTDLPLADASVDLMICYHVLEHVPDDASAMAEIARVVRPGGVAIVQVPHRTGVPTDEDPSAGREERIRRFGQQDHVRYYGDDFEARLEKAGLDVHRIQTDMVPAELVELFRLAAYEPVWLVHPAGAAAPVTAETIQANLAAALPVVMRRMAAHAEVLRVELEEQKAAAERWKRTYRQLRTRLPVRVLLRANRVRRQLVAQARSRSRATT
jgi:SAM-dependent methyltransferase